MVSWVWNFEGTDGKKWHKVLCFTSNVFLVAYLSCSATTCHYSIRVRSTILPYCNLKRKLSWMHGSIVFLEISIAMYKSLQFFPDKTTNFQKLEWLLCVIDYIYVEYRIIQRIKIPNSMTWGIKFAHAYKAIFYCLYMAKMRRVYFRNICKS